ncbi:ABC transporter ATP-binding protein [Frankia sp. CiP1_Cm_nod2]|uniref:ABC transporter ATP-binding protein n=1 Tax=Frankia sp. CiP1_Cm_nod2 TaxID=2897161 RepID=UPI002024592C
MAESGALHAGAPAGPAPVIELDDVRKTYRTGAIEVDALRGVDLRISEGEYIAIMGPSGSGKSTLMNILGCLDIPTSGHYRLAGEDVARMSEDDLAEIRNWRIGFVFQQFNLLPALSAWRNVELPLCYAGTGRARRRVRAVEALERVGLGDRIAHRPNELSGGQQQRVAVARALVTDPALILADEPTGNLDSASTQDVLDLLGELHASGRTIVLITHEPEVAATASRVVRIRDGGIQDDTSLDHPGGDADQPGDVGFGASAGFGAVARPGPGSGSGDGPGSERGPGRTAHGDAARLTWEIRP